MLIGVAERLVGAVDEESDSKALIGDDVFFFRASASSSPILDPFEAVSASLEASSVSLGRFASPGSSEGTPGKSVGL